MNISTKAAVFEFLTRGVFLKIQDDVNKALDALFTEALEQLLDFSRAWKFIITRCGLNLVDDL